MNSYTQAAWMQNIEKDQGAFDETVLEVLGMEVHQIRYGQARRSPKTCPEAEARGEEGRQLDDVRRSACSELLIWRAGSGCWSKDVSLNLLNLRTSYCRLQFRLCAVCVAERQGQP